MTEHKDIQDPKQYGKTDYEKFEYRLSSAETPVEELEEIVMTLAHLPTKEAQNLLVKFRESGRAGEVEWLQFAMEEGQFHYLVPENEQEERDFQALKLCDKREKHACYLTMKSDKSMYLIREYEIESEALNKLLEENLTDDKKEDIRLNISTIHDLMTMEKNRIEEIEIEVSIGEKIIEKIKDGIQLEKYRGIEPWQIANIHLDNENWDGD